LDFWRFLAWNPCLTMGKHQQIIEVECQREYEGKGAYPNYIGDGVINGFYEMPEVIGIKDVISNPLIVGLWNWARGGGWFGPYIKSWEAWESLNTLVIMNWFKQAKITSLKYYDALIPTEEQIFIEHCINFLGLSSDTATIFRQLSLMSSDAVLKMRYCTAFDKTLKGQYWPTNNWMRDDRLAGLPILNPGNGHQWGDVFTYLNQNNLFEDVLQEKNESSQLFQNMTLLANDLKINEMNSTQLNWKKEILTESQYGYYLSRIIYNGWNVMSLGFTGDNTGNYNVSAIRAGINNYDDSWSDYVLFLSENVLAASQYYGYYEGGNAVGVGLNTTIDKYRKI